MTVLRVPLILTALLCMSAPVQAAKPNVIIMYTDDQGSIDANCYGAKDLATPTIDHLAKTGVRFTQMLAPSCICSASRAGLLTGRIPLRAGVPANVSSAKGTSGMPTEQITLAELLRDAGYITGHIGKWHLGFTPETMPNGQGFQTSFGHMGGCIDNYSHFFYWNGPNRHDLWRNGVEIWEDGEFFPQMMVREAKTFLDKQTDDKPFFLYWAINVPHYPLQGTEKWRKHYAKLPAPRRMYAAFISTMDEMMGEVIDHLETRKLRDNTIIIFQSDHGHSHETRTFGGGGNSGPYRGAKGCLFEGGLRVPSIISWPVKIPQNQVRDQFVTGMDWYPTIADYCETPIKHHVDGKSITAVIQKNEESPHNSFYWQMGNGNGAQWAVREGHWKLLGNPRDTTPNGKVNLTFGKERLYLVNLADDIGEKNNLAKLEPEIVERLKAFRQSQLADIQDNKTPTTKSN